MSRSITRPTVVLKETLLARFQMQIRVKKSDVNRSCKPSFAEKHFKAEESVTLQNIFSSVADFRDVVSVLPAARLVKASRIIVALQKANRPSEIKKSSLVFSLSS